MAGSTITLDATGSTDADGPPVQPLTYTWAQVSNGAPTVALSDIHAVKPTFTAPAVTSPGGYTAQFTVTADDGVRWCQHLEPRCRSVSWRPRRPSPSPSRCPGGTFYPGTTVTLAAAITNPDGNNGADYTYAWSQNTGITTTLSNPTAANPTFVIPTNAGAACTSGRLRPTARRSRSS